MNTNLLRSKPGGIQNPKKLQRGLIFGVIICFALLAFEIFNFSTTEFALKDLLGDLSFFGIFWSTILAIAFCGIDFAGIARLFTPEEGKNEPKEVWYLFGAWLLAATMNAMLTWWGISIAILNNNSLGSAVIDRPVLLRIVPIFVALLVWLIRVLIIGTFSLAGEKLFSIADASSPAAPHNPTRGVPSPSPRTSVQPVSAAPAPSSTFRPAPKQPNPPDSPSRPEPTYAPLQAASSNSAPSRRFSGDPANASSTGQGKPDQKFS